jgi:hypothetical protein
MGPAAWRATTLGLAILLLSACATSAAKPGSSASGVRVVARSGFASQPSAGEVFPAVSGGFGQQPRVAAKAKDTPDSPSLAYLSEGTGEHVIPGVAPEVRYVKADWASGRVLHDSWAAGVAREKLPTDDADIAIAALLNDVRIGSRVEIVNPGSGGITVFVVDVLAQGTPSTSPRK